MYILTGVLVAMWLFLLLAASNQKIGVKTYLVADVIKAYLTNLWGSFKTKKV